MASFNPQVVNGVSPPKRSYASIPNILDVPNLIQVQLDSFELLRTEGLRELFEEISPIEDSPGGRFELSFENHYFEEPKYTEQECREKETTFSAPMHVTVKLRIKAAGPSQGEVKEQVLFVGDIPMMTSTGTFVINGAERVVVSQLVRSPGVYFTTDSDATTGRLLAAAKLIPYRGAWMEFDTSNKNIISVKVDRKRKIPISTLLRAMGFATDEELLALFDEVESGSETQYLKSTIDKDAGVTDQKEALMEFYRRLRPGEPPNESNAKSLLDNLFFNPRRYDLGKVGRYKLNRRLKRDAPLDMRTLSPEDIVALLRVMVQINNGYGGSATSTVVVSGNQVTNTTQQSGSVFSVYGKNAIASVTNNLVMGNNGSQNRGSIVYILGFLHIQSWDNLGLFVVVGFMLLMRETTT